MVRRSRKETPLRFPLGISFGRVFARSHSVARWLHAALAFGTGVACLGLTGCVELGAYRTVVPAGNGMQECSAGSAPTAPGAPPCIAQATERNSLYALHFVEFDDQGWPFESAPNEEAQIDSAIGQIRTLLRGTNNCVRLFVYVHGWRHNAKADDANVVRFREFLAQVATASKAAATSGEDACEGPALAGATSSRMPQVSQRSVRKQSAAEVKTVGIYVGWRGLSIADVRPLVYTSFWDRKNTADRVAQGSVRELFGRLNALAMYAPAGDRSLALPAKTNAQLRTYVIGHSFGASVVFRALSQSLIDSFSEDLDANQSEELASVARFVDMVVLVNPAIEASRFDPVFRAAQKLKMYCERSHPSGGLCDQPRYQAPVLAIFSSEGDVANKKAFPIGASLSNAFETTVDDTQRRSIVQTIGWNDNYQTHALSVPQSCKIEDAQPFDPNTNPLRYKAPGWSWCFKTRSGLLAITQLGQTVEKLGERPVYNGPLWNVRVPTSIVSDHNDTWNDRFRDLLLYLFTDERRNSAIF